MTQKITKLIRKTAIYINVTAGCYYTGYYTLNVIAVTIVTISVT